MKNVLSIIWNIIGWVFTIFCVLALVFAVFSFIESKKTGEPVTIFGYRPVYVMTGSMEPCMMTDSIVITKEVSSLDELDVGYVVTYHVENSEGEMVVITHRIAEIDEDGTIITKGDNNRVRDAIPITIDNVEAKVVVTCNWVASIIHLWQNGMKGKIIICAFVIGILVLIFGISTALGEDDEKDKKETKEKNTVASNDTKDKTDSDTIQRTSRDVWLSTDLQDEISKIKDTATVTATVANVTEITDKTDTEEDTTEKVVTTNETNTEDTTNKADTVEKTNTAAKDDTADYRVKEEITEEVATDKEKISEATESETTKEN